MDNETSFNIVIPIVVSLIISAFWLLQRSLLIAYKKDLLEDIREWLSTRSILIPTLAVFFLPMLTAYLTLNSIPDIIKLILPLITFVAGQFLGRYEKRNEIRNKQLEALIILKRKFSISREKISLNKVVFQQELDSINHEDRGFIERRLQFLDKITEDFARLDTFLTLTEDDLLRIDDILNFQKISTLIDEFNELIEDRRDYRVKCRELTTNSVDQYFNLLAYTDKELLKLAKSLEDLIDETSKIEIKL
jgi:hypothetical protein